MHNRVTMSRAILTSSSNRGFVTRFIEVCGSDEPAVVKRLLNISYQAAKNYLNGRVPNPSVLVAISRKTGFSIHWLLMGEGSKYATQASVMDTPPLSRQMEASVRKICVEVINEKLEGKLEPRPKIVVLRPDELLSEKVQEESVPSKENSSK